MRNLKGVALGFMLFAGLGLNVNVEACSTNGWSGNSNIPANADVGSPTAFSRYSEFCALAVTGTSYVQSNYASDTRYIGRFYFYPNVSGSGAVDILVAYSDEGATSPLFKIAYDGTSFLFDAGGASGGSGNTPASSGWNLVEFEYDSGSGNFNFWVNETWDFVTLSYTTGPTGTFVSGTGTVEAVQLGAPNGMASQSGTLSFDAFEAHRTTGVGALIDCDADGTGDPDININDILAVIEERFGNPPVLAPGQPDCDRNGGVNLNDILATIEAAFPSA